MIGFRHNRFAFVGRGPLTAAVVVLALLWMPVASFGFPEEEHPFEVITGSFKMSLSTLVNGVAEPDYQAGAHADWTFSWDFAHNGKEETYNDLKDTVINVPAGFMGNANQFAFPRCTLTQLFGKGVGGGECPVASQIGTITFVLNVGKGPERVTSPVYNMEVTSFGVTAELGFKAAGVYTYTIPISVRPGDQGITSTNLAPETGEPHNVTITIWGLPADPEHDPQRGLECYKKGNPAEECEGGGKHVGIAVVPFLSNPTSCDHLFRAWMNADSWEQPEENVLTGEKASFEVGPITGCERVHFNPKLEVAPTTDAAESSSGLGVSLLVPQTWESPETFATSNVRDVTVTLPQGYTLNPSEGNGLVGCTPAQYAAETSSSRPRCPSQSKLGTVSIETPVLADKIDGNVYLATPYDNPFSEPDHPNGSLLALYVVAKDPARGIVIKTAGKVTPDPVTGQVTSTFEGLPQQPFSKVVFELTQGQTSPLVSPPACGTYVAQAEMTPSSAPSEPRVVDSQLQIEKGIGGGPCPAGGVPPFKPQVVSGAQDNNAGNYTPFYLRIVRNDGEQELTKFTTILPPGLTANLSGIPFCSDAAIQHAREATGQQEISSPSCPGASEIGHTLVGAGVGSILAWTPGKVYLAGPYHGSALSIVSITSATVGPFDLGTVVIRFALRINPITGQAEIDGSASDPIPHILPPGIVVHVRDIHVYIDRAKFMIDPTSCESMSISNAITGAGADIASSTDDQTVNVTTPFQAADCANLGFKPLFKASSSGKTSRTMGASLHVSLTYPKASFGSQANIRSVHVELPKALPSRLSTLNHACLDSVFNQNPANCPSQSRVGFAKAVTPILPVPLEGPAFFVSHGGQKFPELILVLQGYGITIDLQGETFISKAGITSSTFKAIPDAPVGSFELTLPEGPFSALAANRDLCTTSLSMSTAFQAQNGARLHQNTPIEVQGCPYALRIVGRKVKKRHLTLKVSVPVAGKLVASGKGVSKASKRAKGRQTLTLTLKERHSGKLRTRIALRFTPAGPVGKQRGKKAKVLRKSLTVTFR